MVYVDQRGTGQSNYLKCSGSFPRNVGEWQVCAGEQKGVELDHYLSRDAAQDLEFVRQQLGYTTVHIRGGSYGTRVALEYMRLFAQWVGLVILDGVAPPNYDYFYELVTMTDRGVARLLTDCSKSDPCMSTAPNLPKDLADRRSALKANPRPITIGGSAYHETADMFTVILGKALSNMNLRYQVPQAITLAMAGDHTQWDKIMSAVYGTTVGGTSEFFATQTPSPFMAPLPNPNTPIGRELVSWPLYATILCTEFGPNLDPTQTFSGLAKTQKWLYPANVALYSACDDWHQMSFDTASTKPVSSSAKVLILNGDLDTITPPRWGAEAAKTLPNSIEVTVPYTGHSTISTPCAQSIIRDFLKYEGDPQKIELSCLKAMTEPSWSN